MSDLPLVRLVSTSDYGPLNLEDIATFAHGVGPDSAYVMYWPDDVVKPANPTVDPTTPSQFVDYAHSLDLQVHPWTLRIDSLKYTSSPVDEIALYANKGCDGVFTEFVSTTLQVWNTMYSYNQSTSPQAPEQSFLH